jgi:hypothetical protein
MKHLLTSVVRGVILLCGLVGLVASFAFSQSQKCLICHGKPDFKVIREDKSVRMLFVDENEIKSSIHPNHKCQDCHADITEITALGHTKTVKRVNCVRCHYEGNPVGAPETQKYSEYRESVHGKAALAGNPKAPLCQDCHGSHGIQSHKSAQSKVYKLNVMQVCGKCHLNVYTQFITSVHSKALEKESNLDVPSCVSCHGEHNIKRPTDPQSTVYKTTLANTCATCHAAASIVGKYGIKTEQIATFEESFHGIATKFGEKTVANCASCHGVHDIKPEGDPTSSIYPANIPRTCGKCHPDANANYAKGKIHLNPKDEESGAIYYISLFFKWLTISTVSLLVLHILLDLYRKMRRIT